MERTPHRAAAALAFVATLVGLASGCLRSKTETPLSEQSEAAPQSDPSTIFQGRLCVLERPVNRLQEIGRCPALGTIPSHFDVTPRRFTKGFPGITTESEWFTLDFSGSFAARRTGAHRFTLTTDDHAMLWIDGTLVLENPPPRDRKTDRKPISAQTDIALEAGQHRFRLLYLHGRARWLALMLHVVPPGMPSRVFSATL